MRVASLPCWVGDVEVGEQGRFSSLYGSNHPAPKIKSVGLGWRDFKEPDDYEKKAMQTTVIQHIEQSPDIAGGKPRIAGHRITVANVAIWHERLGRTVDEIAAEHNLSLADVYAALAYYFDNREAIDRSIAESEDFVAELRRRLPSKLTGKLRGQD